MPDPLAHTPPAVISAIRERALAFMHGTGFSATTACDAEESMGAVPDLTIIDQLCSWSFAPDPQVARAATSAIFSTIIEPLCDAFSSRGVGLANLVLTRIIHYIRALPQGVDLDRQLQRCGFTTEQEILLRYQAISQPTPLSPAHLMRVKKIIVLSRVTAGADIAITNVIIHRLRLRLPTTEMVLIGPAHLPALFAQVPHCRHRNFIYHNDGTLLAKMTSWPRLRKLCQEEQAGYGSDELLLIDPDTRLTQLGLLPLAPDASTRYFPSRSSQPQGTEGHNLSALANHWLNLLLAEEVACCPKLVFRTQGEGYHSFCRRLHEHGCRLAVVINFGVGNDQRKKVHGGFEEDLIQALLAIPGTIVILDTGRGERKGQWIADHLARVRQQGWNAACLTEAEVTTNTIAFDHGLIIFQGSLGALGKMIDAADGFIGYDSCGQHLAAATSTPAVIVFAGAPSPLFIKRWSPNTPSSLTIPVDTREMTPQAISLLIERITRAVAKLRKKPTEGC